MKTIELPAKDFILKLEVVNDWQWCQVFLIQNNEIKALGAEVSESLAKKFFLVLNPETFLTCDQTIDGKQYTFFLALWEKHTFGYARPTNFGIELHFRSDFNEPLFTVNLSFEECESWRNRLNQLV